MYGSGSNNRNSRAEMLERLLAEGLIDDETFIKEVLLEEESDDDDDEPINQERLNKAMDQTRHTFPIVGAFHDTNKAGGNPDGVALREAKRVARQKKTLREAVNEELTWAFRRFTLLRSSMPSKNDDNSDDQEEQRKLEKPDLIEMCVCQNMMIAIVLMLNTLWKLSDIHNQMRGTIDMSYTRNDFYSYSLYSQPRNLESLLTMCDADCQWGVIRCQAITWMFNIFGSDALMEVKLSSGNYFVYHATATLAKALDDEVFLTKHSDNQNVLHEPGTCNGCWLMIVKQFTLSLRNSRSLVDPTIIVEQILSKYLWRTIFPTRFNLPFLYMHLWMELHRMAHLVILNENENDDKSPAMQQPKAQQSAAMQLLQLELGTDRNNVFQNVMEMIVGGSFINSRLEEPKKLAVPFDQLSRFVMWYYNCLLHRDRDPQLVGLRRRVRVYLLSLLAEHAMTWPEETTESCYMLACWLKDSTWSCFNEQMTQTQQWKAFQCLMFAPGQVSDRKKQRLIYKVLVQTIGLGDDFCAQCWRTNEDLFLLSKRSGRPVHNPYRLLPLVLPRVCNICSQD